MNRLTEAKSECDCEPSVRRFGWIDQMFPNLLWETKALEKVLEKATGDP